MTKQTAPASALDQAIQGAQLLLAFAAQRGIEIDPEIVNKVVRCAGLRRSGEVDAGAEAELWIAYRVLAAKVAPATVDSLRATYDPHPHFTSTLWLKLSGAQVTLARWTALRYRSLAVCTLLLLVAIQVFWLIGWSLTSDILVLEKEVQQLFDERQGLEQAPGAATPAKPIATPEIERIKAKIKTRRGWLGGVYESLEDWNRLWGSVAFFVEKPFETGAFKKLSTRGQYRTELRSARLVLQAMAVYVLPLLYGLLGACAYVLRELAREVREMTFTPASALGYGLRTSLGLLAGIAVGLLIAPEAGINAGIAEVFSNPAPAPTAAEAGGLSLKSLSPLALAFVAGYSVELVFTAMDRIINAFTSHATRPT